MPGSRGDLIVAIDGTATGQLAFEQAVARILGHPDTSVRLVVQRGARRLNLTVRRGRIRNRPLSARLLPGGVGYVHVLEFDGGTTAALGGLGRLERSGAAVGARPPEQPGRLAGRGRRLRLDLRRRAKLLDRRRARGHARAARARRATVSPVRLALLVNRYTASAAEVVAAALRDNERASLVGERTYGKALVQSIEPLPSGVR